jgi:Ca2+-binding EF-hand superfamily protein
VHLSQHLVDVVFTLFDDNGDGELSNKEFIEVMKRRLHRGLQLPKDTGLIRMIEALGVCAVNNVLP